MHPHEVVQDPPGSRGQNPSPFLVWEGRSVLLEGRADAVCEGRIDEETDGPDHQQGHDPLGLFERKRRGQKLRGLQETTPALRLGGPFGAVAHRLGRYLGFVQCIRREANATLLVDACPTVCEPSRQGPGDRVDELVGVGARAWAPPLSLVWRGADGAGMEHWGRHACHKTGAGLLGIRVTSQRGPAQRLDRFDCLGTLGAPLLVDGTLGLSLAWLRLEQAPALRHATLCRQPAARALPLLPRRHGRRLRLGQALLDLGHGRRDAGEPLAAGSGQLVQSLGAREGTVGHARGRAGRSVARRQVVAAHLAERLASAPMATQGLLQQRDTGLGLNDSCQPHLVEVRAMRPTLAVGDGHTLVVGGRSAVRAAINMATRRIEMAERGRPPQTPGRRGGHEAGEGGHPSRVQRIEGAPEGVISAMAGLHAWRHEASDGLRLATMGDEGEGVVEQAQTVKHHGRDRMPCGHHPHARVLLGGCLPDVGDAEGFNHARDQTQGIEDLGTIWLWRRRDGRAVRESPHLLLGRGDCSDTQKLLNDT